MNKKSINPMRSQFTILRQICNLIPEGEVSKIARERAGGFIWLSGEWENLGVRL
jgi:hypothetical protein